MDGPHHFGGADRADIRSHSLAIMRWFNEVDVAKNAGQCIGLQGPGLEAVFLLKINDSAIDDDRKVLGFRILIKKWREK